MPTSPSPGYGRRRPPRDGPLFSRVSADVPCAAQPPGRLRGTRCPQVQRAAYEGRRGHAGKHRVRERVPQGTVSSARCSRSSFFRPGSLRAAARAYCGGGRLPNAFVGPQRRLFANARAAADLRGGLLPARVQAGAADGGPSRASMAMARCARCRPSIKNHSFLRPLDGRYSHF